MEFSAFQLHSLVQDDVDFQSNNVKFDPLHEDNSTEKSSPNDYNSDRDQDDETSQDRAEGVAEIKWVGPHLHRDPDDAFFDTIGSAQDQAFNYDEHMIFGSRQTAVELHTLHPDPAQLFRLWQVYLDNVNPLLKVTHTPTLQARIVDAASNLKEIPPTLEALMFGIYCMAILSLTEDECETMFKQSKEQLSTRFQFGCQQALLNSNFLRTGSRDCLTALFLYLVSVRSASHPKSISAMLAVAVRISERMGLQSEHINARSSVLEAEMRRRLWWALVLFDSRVSALGDHKPTTLAPGWDCALPMNVSDSELREETKNAPKAQEQATEAIFAIVRSELGDFIRNSPYYLSFTNPMMKPLAKRLPEGGDVALEKRLEDKYLRFCDTDNRLHYMTLWTARASIATCRLMNDFLVYLESSAQYTQANHETAVSHAIDWLECDTKLSSSPLTKGFHWFLRLYFPFPAYIRIIQHLKSQPFSSITERGWHVMYDNYAARYAASENDRWHSIFKPFANIVLYAWDTVKTAYEKAEREIETPDLVDFINRKTADMSLEAGSSTGPQVQNNAGMDMDDVQLQMPFGFGDPGMFFNIGGQPGFDAGTSAPYMANTTPLTVNMNQLNWSSMNWGMAGMGENGNW
ncbi:C6 transcription factor [Fusarium beomiforme]|uniref:C6 transcription factor n=1 Tax=Fusarium beomiforme TaxID=44412 RepID=A0A9P5A5C4_9HYPO|nr:C6 transcription factor [Fusarium beomiforme]